MTAPRVGPCQTWPYRPCGVGNPDDEVLVASAATHVLWALSGRRFGICDMGPLRPVARDCLGAFAYERRWQTPVAFGVGYWPYDNDWWWSIGARYPTPGQVKLPGPIAQLTEVRLNGVSLALTGASRAVRVDAWRQLTLLNGETWPTWQDPALEDGPGTAFVSYGRGVPVPELGELAMNELVTELSKSCAGDKTCRLPSRIREMTRKGMTFAMINPQDFIDKGRLGLDACDMFLMTVNPTKLARAPRVFRADAMSEPRYDT